MRGKSPWDILVSPADGRPLQADGSGRLVASDGTVYTSTGGIIDLLDPRFCDEAVTAEIDVFHKLPIERVPYFRQEVFMEAVKVTCDALGRPPESFVEIGGGEGYLAQAFAGASENCMSFVCDVSLRSLANAGAQLHKVRCDARRPYFASGTIDAAAFWVSLHHFSGDDMRMAVRRAAEILKPGGVLLVFEPSEDFIVRRLFYRSKLSRLVYFDDQEKGVRYAALEEWARAENLEPYLVTGRNPSYNLHFLRHFTLWPLFYVATEFLRLLEILLRWGWPSSPPERGNTPGMEARMSQVSLYVLALFIKRPTND